MCFCRVIDFLLVDNWSLSPFISENFRLWSLLWSGETTSTLVLPQPLLRIANKDVNVDAC